MAGLLTLADPECMDSALAGAKAAGLCAARSAGLPVLAGVVVPAAESVPALREAVPRAHSGGVHAAKLAVMESGPDLPDSLREACAAMADFLVVRSSSPLEGTGEWSGAFTSVLDVRPEEVRTAVRAVWASSLSDDTLDRVSRERLDPDALSMAVLVQPQLSPDFSGTAEVGDDGSVTVVVVAGSPVPLMTGWDPGQTARCTPAGAVSGAGAVATAGEEILRRVGDLATAVRRDLGDNLVEWGLAGDELVLLQTKATSSAGPPSPPRAPPARTSAHLSGNAVATAYSVLRYAGPSGEQLVLPWLLAGPDPAPPPVTDRATEEATDRVRHGESDHVCAREALAAWDEAVHLADTLSAQTWPDANGDTTAASGTLAGLRGDHADDALERLAALRPADAIGASRLMELFRGVARHLVAADVLTHPDQLWALEPQDIRRLLLHGGHRDTESATQRAALRWNPFAYTALMSHGEPATGNAASPGEGVGPAVLLTNRTERTALPPRAVLVAPRPLPHLAPLLWGAAALVTFGGGPAAHLIEVARALTVPAVVGCTAEPLLRAAHHPSIVAVDGHHGTAAVGGPRHALAGPFTPWPNH